MLSPILVVFVEGKLSDSLKKKGALLVFLVCAQGLMGWYMVKSGLVKTLRSATFAWPLT